MTNDQVSTCRQTIGEAHAKQSRPAASFQPSWVRTETATGQQTDALWRMSPKQDESRASAFRITGRRHTALIQADKDRFTYRDRSMLAGWVVDWGQPARHDHQNARFSVRE